MEHGGWLDAYDARLFEEHVAAQVEAEMGASQPYDDVESNEEDAPGSDELQEEELEQPHPRADHSEEVPSDDWLFADEASATGREGGAEGGGSSMNAASRDDAEATAARSDSGGGDDDWLLGEGDPLWSINSLQHGGGRPVFPAAVRHPLHQESHETYHDHRKELVIVWSDGEQRVVPLYLSCEHALYYLEIAAQAGNWNSALRKGLDRFLEGSPSEALPLYEVAAEVGYVEAQANVAYLYTSAADSEHGFESVPGQQPSLQSAASPAALAPPVGGEDKQPHDEPSFMQRAASLVRTYVPALNGMAARGWLYVCVSLPLRCATCRWCHQWHANAAITVWWRSPCTTHVAAACRTVSSSSTASTKASFSARQRSCHAACRYVIARYRVCCSPSLLVG